jgi:hypothetical protein
MSSVIAAWQGAVADPTTQDELLSFIARIAELNGEYLAREARVPRFSEIIAAQRQQGQRPREDTEMVDRSLSGRIVVCADIDSDQARFAENVRVAGLELHTPEDGHRTPVTVVEQAALRGCDFRLIDPRRLYPGSDRLSFVFMTCPAAPFLDGRLVAARPGTDLPGTSWEVIRTADWFLECPYIHLRYVLEDWTFQLLSWVKHFFIPDLVWHGYEKLEGYQQEQAVFEQLAARDGIEGAKRHSFYILIEAFRADIEQWMDRFAKMRDDEDDA